MSEAAIILHPSVDKPRSFPIYAGAVDPQTEQARRWAVALENENAELSHKLCEYTRRVRVASAVVADMPCRCVPVAPWCGDQRQGIAECSRHILERLLAGDE